MAAIIVIFSVMAVTAKKILRAATYLLFVLLGTAVLYFQLGYEFLGAVQLAVYAGGIMVLFVFAILLTHKPNEEESKGDSKEGASCGLSCRRRAVGLISSLCGAGLLLFALFTMPVCAEGSLSTMLSSGMDVNMQTIGHALVGTDRFQYLLPFEAVSVLLLACIIGGVVIARKR